MSTLPNGTNPPASTRGQPQRPHPGPVRVTRTGPQADKAVKDFGRTQELFRTRVVSLQDLDAARAANDSAQAQLQANLKKVASDRVQAAEARATVNTFVALLRSAQAQIEQSAADLQTAQLKESYCEIRAPEAGRVTKKVVEPGNYVQTGQTLFALVPANVWVTANYKENQIGLMRAGQPVEIEVDALHGQKFQGHIDSLQGGGDAAFSLLPPENATATTSRSSNGCRSRSSLTPCRRWACRWGRANRSCPRSRSRISITHPWLYWRWPLRPPG